MKRSIIWILITIFAISMLFLGIGCKEEAASEETVVEETTEEIVEEEAVEETEEAEEVTEEEEKEILFATVLVDVYPGWNQAHKAFMDKCEEYGYIGSVAGWRLE